MEDKVLMDEDRRSRIIVRTSIIGILVNVLLASLKAFVGVIVGSIAVILDAINNLSDALSSVVTILGAKLANKKPDKKHPLGYGRIEYISAMIVSAIVLYAGVTAMVESIKKIIEPTDASYSTISLVLIGVFVLTKIILGKYVTSQGKKAGSSSLVASGKDALFDAILSFSVLVCAIINLTLHFSLEAYVGIIISVFIIKSAIEMMLETINDILGRRVESDLSKQIKEIVTSVEGVLGAYDLLVNNYGPNKDYASIHIEVADTLTASEIDEIMRNVQAKVYQETNIVLSGISIYSTNTKDPDIIKIKEKIKNIAFSHEGVLEFHGFYINKEEKDIRFDIVMSFTIDHKETVNLICNEIKELYPDYSIYIVPDVDLSDWFMEERWKN